MTKNIIKFALLVTLGMLANRVSTTTCEDRVLNSYTQMLLVSGTSDEMLAEATYLANACRDILHDDTEFLEKMRGVLYDLRVVLSNPDEPQAVTVIPHLQIIGPTSSKVIQSQSIQEVIARHIISFISDKDTLHAQMEKRDQELDDIRKQVYDVINHNNGLVATVDYMQSKHEQEITHLISIILKQVSILHALKRQVYHNNEIRNKQWFCFGIAVCLLGRILYTIIPHIIY